MSVYYQDVGDIAECLEIGRSTAKLLVGLCNEA